MIMHLYTIVHNVLRSNHNLESIHLIFEIDQSPDYNRAATSDKRMEELEHMCLSSLAELQGLRDRCLHKVEFAGFQFANPEFMYLTTQIITRLRPQPGLVKHLSESFGSIS